MAASDGTHGGRLAGRVQAQPAAFPARTRQATEVVDGVRTDAMAMAFADKILITISQEGRLAHWVHVPLESTDPTFTDRRRQVSDDGSDLLPLPQLTATTILGGGAEARDTMGQLIATQIASAIATRNPEERRLLVLGMGFKNAQFNPDGFAQVVGLAIRCL